VAVLITLTIKKPDGSHYWTEYFNDQKSCDMWLEDEKLRPYWDAKFVCTTVDDAPPKKSDKQLADEKAKAQATAYLYSTDWYCVREFETGKQMPENIRLERIKARALAGM
jgi:hypothetical protein